MRLFDVGERVEEGWPVSSDLRKKRLFLELGRDKQDTDARLFLRFGTSLSNLVFPEARDQPEMLEDLWLDRASLMSDAWGLCLTRHQYPDTEALVRTGIAPGVGGRVWYAFGKGVHILAEGVHISEITEYPIYLLRLTIGSSFEVHRNGELRDQEGTEVPARSSFIWDGKELGVG
jgi:hypothetical protein